jgi:pimeloyl-ACP methyl ester carboxylesterase
MTSAGSTVRTIAGVDVHIEGNGAETILMLHGWPDTHRLWDAQVEHLRPRWRCLRFTLPGFDGARPRRGHSLDALVDILKQVVEQTCAGQPVTLLLHDWGCMFGYQFALRHPRLVKRVIGVDIGDAGSRAHLGSMPLKAKLMVFGYQTWLALAWRIDLAFGAGRGSTAETAAPSHPTVGDRMTRAMARWARCPADPHLIHAGMCYPYDIAWTGSHGGYRKVLPMRPRWPMLYLYGRRKPFQFQSNEWVDALRATPGSKVIEFNTGHWLMAARPQEFNQAVDAWLAAPALQTHEGVSA